MMKSSPRFMFVIWSLVLAAACGGGRVPEAPAPAERVKAPPAPPAPADASRIRQPPQPAVDPSVAMTLGLMPLKSAGVDAFRSTYPRYDGRGVIIAILDSGVDPGVAGLITTSTGSPKVLDLRDFSQEGRIALVPVTPTDDGRITIGERTLRGTARVARLTTATVWYAGVFRELPLGEPPASDVNGNGVNTDVFPVVVVKAPEGWAAFIDTNLDGSFEDEMPLHDYRQGRETIALGTQPITIAANFSEADRAPVLDLYFDTSGHGTHVSGIAAGHDMFNLRGFDGVAPGAQIIGLKIANNARGGVSVHGSMIRAMDYAARFAEQRGLPLVMNLSFGVGNEQEGRAVIDSLVDAFLRTHPEIVFTISAGNDGPGLSTVGFPGSADLALSVGASYPGVFAQAPQPGIPPAPDVVGWFSARGGELAKPDILAPGVIFSVVPAWETGDEIKGGTSMAAPYAAGLAACLVSAMAQEGRRVSATEVMQALRVSARRFAEGAPIDQGFGTPILERAYAWLKAGHQGSTYEVRARSGAGAGAAFRRNGFSAAGDTIETFAVRHVAGLRAARFLLRTDAPWLSVPASFDAAPRSTEIPVVYRRSAISAPGVYVGTVTAYNPSDTLAGPLFRLVSTIVVPHDLASRPLVDDARSVGPAAIRRYFLRVTKPGATLRATVVLTDSVAQQATVRLYEPNGAPARSAPGDIDLGGEDGEGTGVVTVRGDDLVPGVYELDVVAPPLAGTSVSVRADLGPVALEPASGMSTLEAAPALTGAGGSGTVNGQIVHRLVGAERSYAMAGRGEPAETLLVRAPSWAKRVEVDLAVSAELWHELTDLSITVYDSTGQQVPGANEAVNYAFGRLRFSLPDSLAGRPLTVELYPAFARRTPHAWRGAAAIRFLGPDEPVGEGGELSVVAGGRVVVRLPGPPAFELPDGFGALIETRVTTAAGAVSARRTRLEGAGAAR
jgi:tripeptidyl-peptidase-2